jgi:16S rRNA G966 N2-methylase RsmD
VIQTNLDNTGFGSRGKVHNALVEGSLGNLAGPYQLVLLDPPYSLQTLGEILEKIGSAPGLVNQGGMVVAGHSRHLALLPGYGQLRLVSNRRYGDNLVDFYLLEIVNGD